MFVKNYCFFLAGTHAVLRASRGVSELGVTAPRGYPLLTTLLPKYKRPFYINILLPQGHLLRAVIFNQSPMYNAQSVAAFL